VSLEPMADKLLDSLDLYPPRLISYILWEAKERSLTSYILNTYEDMLEFICEIIGLHVHKHDDLLLKRLLLIYDHIDNFFDLSIDRHHLFYIFPLLAYVIQRAMDRLSDPEFNINYIEE
jgi:hypothetical protein